jgi:hypothetical protein
MIIKVKKPIVEQNMKHDHMHLSRRDFISRGIYAGALTVALPKILAGGLIKDAVAAATCPAPSRTPGGMSHLFCDGGFTVGAYILTDTPSGIAASSATAAARYGIDQTMLNLGPNFNVNANSMFWKTLQAAGPDLGYTATTWRVALAKVGAGAHYGPFNQDDGGADGTGLVYRLGSLKKSDIAKSLEIGVSHKLVPFSNGMPVATVKGRPAVTDLAKVFSLTPSNLTNAATMANSAAAAGMLSDLFSSMMGISGRTGGSTATTNTTCGFVGDATVADPTYGATLFDPTKIAALTPLTASGKISAGEQAYLAAFYNASIGITSGNGIQEGGFDYHGQDVTTNIGPACQRVARIVAMWVAASDKAGAVSTLSIVSNGQAIAKGFTNTTVNGINGNVQNASGDSGGNFNAATLLCYQPSGAIALKSVGAFDTSNGDVRSTLSSEVALAGIAATALAMISGGSVTDSVRARLGFSSTQDMKSAMLI